MPRQLRRKAEDERTRTSGGRSSSFVPSAVISCLTGAVADDIYAKIKARCHGAVPLQMMRAAQNRHCFGTWRDAGSGVAMQRACADYARLASDVLAAVRGRAG